MEVKVYLTKGGLESVAKGRELQSWDFSDTTNEVPQHCMLVGVVEVKIPSVDLCAKKAVAGLEAELQEMRANAYKEERILQERIANLLALPAPVARDEAFDNPHHGHRNPDDDIPF